MKDWKKQYEQFEEENEFYGLPYDEMTSSLIITFIGIILANKCEETIRDIERIINNK